MLNCNIICCFVWLCKLFSQPKGWHILLGYLREICAKVYLGNQREETTLKVLGKMGVKYWNGCNDVDWIHLAQDTDQWWTPMKKVADFLTRWAVISFSGRTLPCDVCNCVPWPTKFWLQMNGWFVNEECQSFHMHS
jgi:hypothetical protein